MLVDSTKVEFSIIKHEVSITCKLILIIGDLSLSISERMPNKKIKINKNLLIKVKSSVNKNTLIIKYSPPDIGIFLLFTKDLCL